MEGGTCYSAPPWRCRPVCNLELIGEAAIHIPVAIRQANPQIPWQLVIATRSQLIHGYLGIDNDDKLGNIICSDVPAGFPICSRLKPNLSDTDLQN
jgi:uncharacterized protein with HEPN domain